LQKLTNIFAQFALQLDLIYILFGEIK